MTTENIVINIREDGARVVTRNLDSLGDSAEKSAKKTDILHASMRSLVTQAYGLGTMFRRLASVLLINEFIKASDAATLLDARLKMLIKSSTDLAKAQSDIYKISQANSLNLKDTADLYTKIYDPVTRLGGSIKEVSAITNAFGMTLRISGANVTQTAAATQQFTQAMTSGRMAGDEFKSMAENNPRFLKALAESMNLPIERLKEMGSQGLLTSDVLGNAMIRSLEGLRKEASGLTSVLIGAAFTRWYNDTVLLIDAFNKLTGASSGLVATIDGMSSLTSELSKIMKEELADGTKVATGGFDVMDATIRGVGTVLETFILLGSDVVYMVKAIGREIGGMSAQLVAIASGDFKQVSAIRAAMIEDANNAAIELERFQNRIASLTQRTLNAREKAKSDKSTPGSGAGELKAKFDEESLVETRMRLAGITKSYIEDLNRLQKGYESGAISLPLYKQQLTELATQTYENSTAGKAHAKTLKEVKTDYSALIKTISEKTEIERGSLQSEDKLTAGQKLALKVMSDLRDNNIKLVATKSMTITQQKIAIAQGLEELLQTEKLSAAHKLEADARQELFDATTQDIKSIDDAIKRQKEHNEEIGKTKSQIADLQNARLLDSAATDQQSASELFLNIVLGKTDAAMFKQVVQLEELARKKRTLAAEFNKGATLESDEANKKSLKESADYVNNLLDPTKVDRFSEALKSGIKGAAGAFIPLIKALDTYQAKQATLAKLETENNRLVVAGLKSQAQASEEYTTKEVEYRLTSYGDMAGAAKGFFKENTEGYKTMATIEKIFRATELANTVTNYAMKSGLLNAFTSMFVASRATEATADTSATAVSVANSAVRASADGVAGVAKAIASMPFPLNIAAGAATLAALVSLGVKMSGGIGSGGVDMTKPRQDQAGTGSVLGDAAAKSESISKSSELMLKLSQNQLSHTISMDNSLKTIASNMAGLTNVVIRSGSTDLASKGIQTGTSLNTGSFAVGAVGSALLLAGPLGAVTMLLAKQIPVIGNLLTKLFGNTTSVLDQGITAMSVKLGDLDKLGIQAMSYADVRTTKKFLGITYSDKTKQTTQALPDEVSNQFEMVITSLADSVKVAAGVIGVSGDEFTERLNNFVIDIGHISTKGLTGEQIQKQFETIFSRIGDDMAKSAVSGLSDFQKVGEGAYETLMRIAAGFLSVNDALTSIGMKTLSVGAAGLKASDFLINLAGGLDKFTERTSYFAENFLEESERIAPIAAQLKIRMTELGQGSVTTMDGFKKLALGLDVADQSQAILFDELMKLAPAFKMVADATAKTTEASAENIKKLEAIENEKKDLQDQLNRLTLDEIALAKMRKDAIDKSNHGLYDQVVAAQAAKDKADALKQTNDKLQAQIDELIFATLSLSEQRKLETKDMDASTLALQKRIYKLTDEAAAAEAAKQAADKLKSTNDDIQAQIDALTKASIPLAYQRASELIGIDETTAALKRQLFAKQDEIAAAEKTKASSEALKSTNDSLETQIKNLEKSTMSLAGQRAVELIGLDDSTVALKKRLYILTDEITAANLLSKTNADLENQIKNLVKASLPLAEQRKLETAGMADSTLKLQERVYQLQDEAEATLKAKKAMDDLKNTNDSIQAQIDAIVKSSMSLEDQRKLELVGIDKTTEALKKQLWSLQDAAQAVLDKAALEKKVQEDRDKAEADARTAYNAWIDDVKAAFSRESGVFKDLIEQFTKLGESLDNYRKSLDIGKFAALSPEANYLALKEELRVVGEKALQGDKGALERFPSAADAFLEASRQYNASGAQYFADLQYVKDLTESAKISAYAQVDVARLQLALLEQQVKGLFDINESVKRVADLLSSGASVAPSGSLTNPVLSQMASIPATNNVVIQSSTNQTSSQVVTNVQIDDETKELLRQNNELLIAQLAQADYANTAKVEKMNALNKNLEKFGAAVELEASK